MCLAQGHNAVTPVRLEPTTPRPRVKHSTTEPLRSLLKDSDTESENLSSLIRLSVSDNQKTDSSKDVIIRACISDSLAFNVAVHEEKLKDAVKMK